MNISSRVDNDCATFLKIILHIGDIMSKTLQRYLNSNMFTKVSLTTLASLDKGIQ